jgi:hypothetical protein
MTMLDFRSSETCSSKDKSHEPGAAIGISTTRIALFLKSNPFILFAIFHFGAQSSRNHESPRVSTLIVFFDLIKAAPCTDLPSRGSQKYSLPQYMDYIDRFTAILPAAHEMIPLFYKASRLRPSPTPKRLLVHEKTCSDLEL